MYRLLCFLDDVRVAILAFSTCKCVDKPHCSDTEHCAEDCDNAVTYYSNRVAGRDVTSTFLCVLDMQCCAGRFDRVGLRLGSVCLWLWSVIGLHAETCCVISGLLILCVGQLFANGCFVSVPLV
jgi:hypothetical protein